MFANAPRVNVTSEIPAREYSRESEKFLKSPVYAIFTSADDDDISRGMHRSRLDSLFLSLSLSNFNRLYVPLYLVVIHLFCMFCLKELDIVHSDIHSAINYKQCGLRL